MADIIIETAPLNYRKYLNFGDKHGNGNGRIDSIDEANIAAERFCTDNPLNECGRLLEEDEKTIFDMNFIGYLEKQGYSSLRAHLIRTDAGEAIIEKQINFHRAILLAEDYENGNYSEEQQGALKALSIFLSTNISLKIKEKAIDVLIEVLNTWNGRNISQDKIRAVSRLLSKVIYEYSKTSSPEPLRRLALNKLLTSIESIHLDYCCEYNSIKNLMHNIATDPRISTEVRSGMMNFLVKAISTGRIYYVSYPIENAFIILGSFLEDETTDARTIKEVVELFIKEVRKTNNALAKDFEMLAENPKNTYKFILLMYHAIGKEDLTLTLNTIHETINYLLGQAFAKNKIHSLFYWIFENFIPRWVKIDQRHAPFSSGWAIFKVYEPISDVRMFFEVSLKSGLNQEEIISLIDSILEAKIDYSRVADLPKNPFKIAIETISFLMERGYKNKEIYLAIKTIIDVTKNDTFVCGGLEAFMKIARIEPDITKAIDWIKFVMQMPFGGQPDIQLLGKKTYEYKQSLLKFLPNFILLGATKEQVSSFVDAEPECLMVPDYWTGTKRLIDGFVGLGFNREEIFYYLNRIVKYPEERSWDEKFKGTTIMLEQLKGMEKAGIKEILDIATQAKESVSFSYRLRMLPALARSGLIKQEIEQVFTTIVEGKITDKGNIPEELVSRTTKSLLVTLRDKNGHVRLGSAMLLERIASSNIDITQKIMMIGPLIRALNDNFYVYGFGGKDYAKIALNTLLKSEIPTERKSEIKKALDKINNNKK